MKKQLLFIPALTLVLALLAACASAPLPPDIDTMEPSVIIQRAQERADLNDWKGAEQLYQYCADKYADDMYVKTLCRYEIGFAAYKQGQYERAKTILSALVADYQGPQASEMPPHILKLAKMLLETIDAKTGKSK